MTVSDGRSGNSPRARRYGEVYGSAVTAGTAVTQRDPDVNASPAGAPRALDAAACEPPSERVSCEREFALLGAPLLVGGTEVFGGDFAVLLAAVG